MYSAYNLGIFSLSCAAAVHAVFDTMPRVRTSEVSHKYCAGCVRDGC
jgi:hypothetical protein